LAENSLDRSHRYQSLEMLMFRLVFTDSATHIFTFAAVLPDPCFGVRTIHGLILPVMDEDFPTLDVNRQYVRVGYICIFFSQLLPWKIFIQGSRFRRR
jgi:hypothetical protein